MRITEIVVHPYNPSDLYYYIVNEAGVTYKSSDLDTLIRYFCQHTQQKATKIGRSDESTRD